MLHPAGYSDAQQQACLSGALADYAAWKETWVDFTFNTFTATDSTPVTQDPAFVTSVMEGCTVASHCILATHYLDNPLAFKDDGGQMQNLFIYEQIQSQANSLADFQTAAPVYLDWCGALEQAFMMKGLSVELWPVVGKTGFTNFSPAQVANLAATLATGTPPNPSLCP